MNKFKFGDKVWHEEYGLCVAIKEVTAENGKMGCVIINEDGQATIVDAKVLTHATDWVKCSERMPEIDVPVLVHTGNGMDIDHTYDFGDGVSFYDDLYGEFTHWMPLPAPPVEVE